MPLVITSPYNVTPVPAYAATILADSPSGYYRLEETSGLNLFDENAPGNPTFAATIPVAYTAGVDYNLGVSGLVNIPGNLGFRNINARFDCPASVIPNWLGSWTIEWWCYLPGPAPISVFYEQSGGVNAHIISYQPSNNNVIMTVNGSNIIVTAPNTFLTDTTYHCATTHNGGTNVINFYVNGVSLGSNPGTLHNNFPLYFGRRVNFNDLPFNGTYDEVAIYTYELTQPQLLAHYNAGI